VSSNDFVKQARAHFDRGAFQDAANVCRRGLLANPDEVEARLILGRSLMALQRYGEVLAEVRVLLDREPGNAQGMALRGEALLYKGDVSKAVQALREAHAAAPHDAAIRALREQAENAAAKEAQAFIFVDEDPSATMTKHYPSRPGPPQQGAQGPGGAGATSAAKLIDGIIGKQQPAPASGEGARPGARSTLPGGPAQPRPAPGAAPAGARPAPGAAPAGPRPAPGAPPAGARPAPGTAPAGPRPAPGAAPAGARPAPGAAPAGPRPAPGAAPAGPRQASPPAGPAAAPPGRAKPPVAPAAPPAFERDQNIPFEEPTAIYGDQLGKPLPQPATRDSSPPGSLGKLQPTARDAGSPPAGPGKPQPTRDSSVPPAPAAVNPSASAPPDLPPGDSDVSFDAAEFDEEMAPTAMIDVERPWRARPVTSAVPAKPNTLEEPTLEAPPPLPPRSTVTAPAPARNAPVSPVPAGRPASDPLGGSHDTGEATIRKPPPTAAPARMPLPASAETPPQGAPVPARKAPEPPVARPAERPAAMPATTTSAPAPAPRAPQPPPQARPAPAAPSTPRAAPAVAESAPAPSYEPTVAVPRQSRQGARAWLYVLAALVFIGGGAFGGLQIRKLRLGWEIDAARVNADALMALDTYAGYLSARNVYASIVSVRATPADQAALARSQAALAAEFDEGHAEAQSAVTALGDVAGTDAVLARAYLALADRDAAGALSHANALAGQAPDDPFAIYLVGRARLLTGDHAGALEAFQKAVERSARPLFLVWLGRAHLALAQPEKAAAAFARALERVPGHPAALLGRAELAAAGTGPAPEGLEATLASLIAEGARPLAEQAVGVSPGEMARAALSLVALRMQRGDEPGARKALDQLQAMRRDGDPGFAVILAEALERLGDTDAALAELARAVEAGPTRLDARVAWAELALRAGKLDIARAALIDVDAATSEVIARNIPALALRGRTQLAVGALDRALADLDAALAEYPAAPELVRARAELDLLQGNAKAAAERLAPVAGADAPSEMRVLYASALRASGQYDQARAVLEAVQKAPAVPPLTYLELARIARDQGRWVEARNAYAHAIERLKGADGAAPGTAEARASARTEARIEAVRLALDTGDRTAARESITAMAREGATKNDGRVLVEAARIHTLDGAHEQAAGYLERAAALSSPPQPGLSRERGRLLLRQGDPKAAAEALATVRTMAGGDPETLLLSIEAELAQGNASAAAALYEDVAKQPDVNPAVLSIAAGMLAEAGSKYEEALGAYDKARELFTARNAAPRLVAHVDYLTGRTLFEYDRLREAEKALEKSIRADPGRADPYFVLGMVQYGSGDFGDAADAFEEAIRRDVASLPEAWFYLGEVELERKHESEARAAFQAYLDLSPQGAKAEDAKRYLDQLEE
jgi:tetratricopeptide (TPR) repeat protein